MAWYKSTLKQSGGADLLALATGSEASFDMTDANVQTSATKIPKYMFYGNNTVRTIELTRILRVEESAFAGAPAIMDVSLPNCTYIGVNAFNGSGGNYGGSYSLHNRINIPACVTIENAAFWGIRLRTTVSNKFTVVLTACETIANNAFNFDGEYLNNLNLPSIVTMANYAMRNAKCEKIDIGDTCTALNEKPFFNFQTTTLICRAINPPTLASAGLGFTPSVIYVPDASVSAYEAASGWAQYAGLFDGLSNLPT